MISDNTVALTLRCCSPFKKDQKKTIPEGCTSEDLDKSVAQLKFEIRKVRGYSCCCAGDLL